MNFLQLISVKFVKVTGRGIPKKKKVKLDQWNHSVTVTFIEYLTCVSNTSNVRLMQTSQQIFSRATISCYY